MDDQEALQKVIEWSHAFLAANGCNITLDISLQREENGYSYAFFNLGGEDKDFILYLSPIHTLPPAEARMYVWGLISRFNVATVASQALMQRLNSAEEEYFEIMDAQAIIKGEDIGEVQTLD